MPKGDKTAVRHRVFIAEYLVNGFNATQAAIKAGYSKKTANREGSRLLSKADIRDQIDQEINRVLDGRRAELKRIVVDEYEKIARSDIKTLLEYDQDGVVVYPSGDVDTSVISQVEIEQEILSSKGNKDITVSNKKIKIKLHDKNKALEGLGRYLKMFTDKIEIPGGVSIIIDNDDANL